VVELLELIAEARLAERPCALVLGFLLSPSKRSVLVFLKGRLEMSEGEGSELLNSDDSNILDTSLGSLVLKVVVDLTRAEDNLANGGIVHQIGGSVRQDLLESESLLEFFEVRVGISQLEELLGSDHNKRLSESSMHLSSQQVEVLGGSGRVSDTHV